MAASIVTSDTFRHPDGTYRYRIYLNGVLCLTSGGFMLQRDAERCGNHIATDPEAVAILTKEHS